jgi:hypothetical protein
LLAALDYNGGSGARGSAQILLRAAVAAVLNASSPTYMSYPLTAATNIDKANAARASGNRSTMLNLAKQLDGYNNQRCPLK